MNKWWVLVRDVLRGYDDNDVASARMKLLRHPMSALTHREMRAVMAADDGLGEDFGC